MKIEQMEKKAERLHEHIKENPADYTAVIAELKLKSEIIDKVRMDKVHERLKEVARIRKRRKEHAEQRQRDGDGGGFVEEHSTVGCDGDSPANTI